MDAFIYCLYLCVYVCIKLVQAPVNCAWCLSYLFYIVIIYDTHEYQSEANYAAERTRDDISIITEISSYMYGQAIYNAPILKSGFLRKLF